MSGDQGKEDDESLRDLKEKLQIQLEQSGMTDVIKKLVEDICSSKEDASLTNPEEVLQAIYKRGLMQNIMDKFDNANNISSIDKQEPTEEEAQQAERRHDHQKSKAIQSLYGEPILKLDSDISFSQSMDNKTELENVHFKSSLQDDRRYYLKVEIFGGKAFLDHLSHENNAKSAMSIICSHKLMLHVFYKSQRFTSKSVDCCCDPHFKDVFMIDIGYFQSGSAAKLLCMNEPLRIVIIREDVNLPTSGGTGIVISYTLHDWRSVLLTDNGFESFTLELMGTGPEHSVPVGLLNVTLTLMPLVDEQVSEGTYLSQIHSEKANEEDRSRSFIAFTKKWWKDFIDIRPGHALRGVKMFAYDDRMRSQPLVRFVEPMVSDEVFLTPFHAAWFTSLIPLKQKDNVPESSAFSDEQAHGHIQIDKPWQTLDTTIASKQGGVEDHAVLLCSLLLGFGLNAFVALGSKKGKTTWAWTVTFDNSFPFQPTFWESTTGKHYKLLTQPETVELPDEIVARTKQNEFHSFQSIGCLFNNDRFLVNIQATDSINFIDWNIFDPSKWKCLPSKVLALVPRPSCAPNLRTHTINSTLIQKDIEIELKNRIADTRKRENLTTRWDDVLSKLMGQQLASYELEESTGGSNFENLFEAAVIKHIPAGYDFKGFPFHSRSINARFIYYSCISDEQFQEVLHCRGDNVHHSLRVMIFSYPENVISVRLMVGCRYIATD